MVNTIFIFLMNCLHRTSPILHMKIIIDKMYGNEMEMKMAGYKRRGILPLQLYFYSFILLLIS